MSTELSTEHLIGVVHNRGFAARLTENQNSPLDSAANTRVLRHFTLPNPIH